MNFFKKKKDLPKIRVVGLQLRCSDGAISDWTRECIGGLGEDAAMDEAYQTLKECQQAIENSTSEQKITVLLPRFGLIRLECFKDISILRHNKE